MPKPHPLTGRTESIEVRCIDPRHDGDRTITLWVRPQDLQAWTGPTPPFVQECFPYLNSDEREVLISRVCGPCFDRLFS